VSKVVGVGVTYSILKVVLRRNIRVDLSWSIGRFGSWGIRWCWSWSWGRGIGWCWSRSRGWSICRSWSRPIVGALWPGKGNCSNGRESKDLNKEKYNRLKDNLDWVRLVSHVKNLEVKIINLVYLVREKQYNSPYL